MHVNIKPKNCHGFKRQHCLVQIFIVLQVTQKNETGGGGDMK